MALASKDISLILNLLNEDTCGSYLTFEQVGHQFRQLVSSSDYARLANGLLLLLQNRDLTAIPQQRLIIFYLFTVMYPIDEDSIEKNPFSSVFLFLLENSPETPTKNYHWKLSPITNHERSFLSILINNQSKDILSKTPNQIIQSILTTNDLIEQKKSRNKLREKLRNHHEEIPRRAQSHLPAVIDDPEINSYDFDALLTGFRHYSRDSQQTIESLFSTDAMNQTIAPQYLRLVPALYECSIDEMAWLNVNESDCSMFCWDSHIRTTMNEQQAMKSRLERACRGLLSLNEQVQLANDISALENFIETIDFDPSKLQLLIEHSPSVCFQLLLKFSSTDKILDYLTAFFNMEVSVHSIELVNRLSGSIKLPQDFLHQYILICIKTCEDTKDRYLRNRLVRLVSIFVESLIRTKIIDIREIFIGLQKFSLQFATVREAHGLFQLLQTVNSQLDSVDQTNLTTSSVSVQDN